MTPGELMERLSGLRRAQIGGRRAPHKPLLWLLGRFAVTGSALAPYAEAADPVSRLFNDFGPPVTSPALERQRAAMLCVPKTCATWADAPQLAVGSVWRLASSGHVSGGPGVR